MSGYVVNEVAQPIGWRERPAALVAVAVALVLAKLPPRRLRRALQLARRGARPATEAQAARARNAVVAVSKRCTGQWCLQRSIATVLRCRVAGVWPEWLTGVQTRPFRAHAWVQVDGRPVGEHDIQVRRFRVVMKV